MNEEAHYVGRMQPPEPEPPKTIHAEIYEIQDHSQHMLLDRNVYLVKVRLREPSGMIIGEHEQIFEIDTKSLRQYPTDRALFDKVHTWIYSLGATDIQPIRSFY